MAATDDDAPLVLRLRRGDPAAAEQLFSRHLPGAWRTAFALTADAHRADDIVQDAFILAFTRIDQLNGGSFANWLRRIVVNQALTAARAERATVPLDGVDLVAPRAAGADVDLMAAVARLEPARREVIVLRYYLGYPVQETADLLGLPRGTVQSRQCRALGDLRRLLGES
jgi:RNA polymerase sigma-70 factor, ECF subfamily